MKCLPCAEEISEVEPLHSSVDTETTGNKMDTFFSEVKRSQIIEGAFSEVEEGKTMIQAILETYALFAIANYENCGKKDNTVEANMNIHGSPYIVTIEATVVERSK